MEFMRILLIYYSDYSLFWTIIDFELLRFSKDTLNMLCFVENICLYISKKLNIMEGEKREIDIRRKKENINFKILCI